MFCSLNRWLGFPNRLYCDSEFSFKNLIKAYNGKCPCFMSVARYEGRNEPYMDKFPFDFDSNYSWRIPYKETGKLLNFFCKKDIPHRIIGSGGKGFHFYFGFKEIPVNDENNSKIFSIQYALKHYLNLQSADEPLFGKKALLIRIPTTKYVSIKKEGKQRMFVSNGNYCRYISDDDFEKGLAHVEKLLKEPGEVPTNPKTNMTLDEIIEKIPDYSFKKKFNGEFDLDIKQDGILTPSTCAVGLPCLQKIALNKHPSHQERIELVSWLKVQGYRDLAINAYIKALHWSDYNYKDTADNVASIKPRFPTCSWLRERYPDDCNNCPLRRKK